MISPRAVLGGITKMEMLDCVGVPEFFITVIGRVEPAGAGCIRLYGCSEKGGLLVPQYTVVMPALSMISATKFVRETALDIFQKEHMAGALAH